MSLTTTVIGAFPKPEYLPTPDWFRSGGTGITNPTEAYSRYLEELPEEIEELLDRATADVVRRQVELGIDIPTDGEVRRENYIHYQCRNFAGIDFENLTRLSLRSGAWVADVPTITGKIEAGEPILPRDYRVAQAASDRPVKITLPGPLTIAGSTANTYYRDEAELGADLATALNREVRALAEAGCRIIQIDEPVFARTPEKALAFGFDNLERCFEGLPEQVTRVVHMCCGYPDRLDQQDFQKASREAYFQLADAIEASSIDAISLEDAHRHFELHLLETFQKTTVIFGSIAIASSRVEPTEEIANRLSQALHHIDRDRLMVAPDCGLGYLTGGLAEQKLRNMVAAANQV
ncbi:MAG: cobalamin-independent methionine synthase II family protein [Trueperaceae bacterium]|nr:MAG: cobalamin-independent methionine synthase II family protein [Trueperaceae bacterium]